MGASDDQMVAPTVTVETESVEVPVVVPKQTNTARENLARAIDGVQDTNITASDFDGFRQSIESGTSLSLEEQRTLLELALKATKKHDALNSAVVNFIKY